MGAGAVQQEWREIEFWGGPSDGERARWRPLRSDAMPSPIVRVLDYADASRPTLPHPVTVHVYCLEELTGARFRYRYTGTELLP